MGLVLIFKSFSVYKILLVYHEMAFMSLACDDSPIRVLGKMVFGFLIFSSYLLSFDILNMENINTKEISLSGAGRSNKVASLTGVSFGEWSGEI